MIDSEAFRISAYNCDFLSINNDEPVPTDTTYSHLPKLQSESIHLPLSKLQQWSYWLAAQLVEQWRYLPMNDCSIQMVNKQLGLTAESEDSLIARLNTTPEDSLLTLQPNLRVELFFSKQPQKLGEEKRKWLGEEAGKLLQWFNKLPSLSSQSPQTVLTKGCLAQLRENVIKVRLELMQQLQACLAQTGEVGTKAFLNWLGTLIHNFEVIYSSYEAEQQIHLQKAISVWGAYHDLSAEFIEGRRDEKAVFYTLAKAYSLKLEAEMYAQAAQLVSELVEQTRHFTIRVSQIDATLAAIQCWLTQQGLSEPPLVAPLLLKSLEQDMAQLCSEFESDLFSNLDLSSAPDATAAMGEKILARLWPLCSNVYTQCYRCLLD